MTKYNQINILKFPEYNIFNAVGWAFAVNDSYVLTHDIFRSFFRKQII